MKKIFTVNGREIEVIDCTAIAKSAGDNTRQKAILIRDLTASSGDADSIIFDMSVKDIDTIDDLDLEYSTYEEDIETVEINGISIKNFVSGEL